MSSIFFLLTLLCLVMPQNAKPPPIVIVPGIGGSQLQAKLERTDVKHYWCERSSSWFTMWLSIEELLPLAIECWTDNMKLVYDEETGSMINTPGVLTRIPDFGNTTGIEYLDPSLGFAGKYFAPLVDALVAQLGYRRGYDLRGAPYDFRFGPETAGEYFLSLKKLIENTYKENGKMKVVLMSQSMGCPYSLYFLHRQSKEWKDTYLSTWITISGVFAGAVKAVRAYISGDPFGVPTYIDKPIRMRPAQRSYSSLSFILPSTDFWNKDEVIVQTDKRSYSVYDFKELFEDLQYPLGNIIRKRVPSSWSPVTPDVSIYCFHGSGLPTPGTLVYGPGQFPDDQPGLKTDDGDGTVNVRSLRGCLRWSRNQTEPIHHKEFPGAEHNGILGDPRFIVTIINLLKSL